MSEAGGRDWNRRRKVPVAAVEIADDLVISVPVEVAWQRLEDLPALAGCVPGFVPESFRRVSATDFEGQIRATALGVTANWQMRANVRAHPGEHTMAVKLQGEDPRLGLRVEGAADICVSPGGAPASRLRYSGQVTVTGRLAAAGGPIINVVVQTMLGRFAAALGRSDAAQATPVRWWRRWLRALARLMVRTAPTPPHL